MGMVLRKLLKNCEWTWCLKVIEEDFYCQECKFGCDEDLHGRMEPYEGANTTVRGAEHWGLTQHVIHTWYGDKVTMNYVQINQGGQSEE